MNRVNKSEQLIPRVPHLIHVILSLSFRHAGKYARWKMTPARDPKQLFLMATWMRNRGGGVMEETSLTRNHGGGIMEETSLMRNHGGGAMDEESWRRHR